MYDSGFSQSFICHWIDNVEDEPFASLDLKG